MDYLWACWVDCKPLLKGRALRLTNGDHDAAEELLSATILKAANHFSGRPVELRDPKAFFMFALKNEFISQYRKKRHEFKHRDTELDVHEDRVAQGDWEARGQEKELVTREELTRLQGALTDLPPIYREIFSMKFVEERSYPEISEVLEISQALARKRVQFLRQKLRVIVAD
ncbi:MULTISPECIES: RNA polymerase sigma factor [Pseudovibrio]|uniref:RNA polymerase sigma factor n=1 Tax=Stappiaceae TaxID=2821832 RepID=UPI002366BCFA|nr:MULTISPECIES: sigma-70 family RNA polymerase sigma factor [Pseudovibrio]MDD7910371.1 sigma-70 family RNA polymerase sigma factor [Pseudovibrio exalbescens]MDX5594086.1 sigma-70 family RNA polymerase sigma factor [Pseudovibrio sp. SPO723]